MLSAIDISTSALVAQRLRLHTIANNIANLNTTRNEAGEPAPYQPRYAVFETSPDSKGPFGAAGVQVSSIETDQREPNWKYEPGHPDAVQEGPKQGYVAYPQISMMHEFTDAMLASRAYEANVGVIEISKNMMEQTLRIVA